MPEHPTIAKTLATATVATTPATKPCCADDMEPIPPPRRGLGPRKIGQQQRPGLALLVPPCHPGW
eukprot:11186435-Lingulodinium_polyedra.AAC.1